MNNPHNCGKISMVARTFLIGIAALMVLPSCAKEQVRACTPPRAYWHKRGAGIGLEPVYNKLALRHDDKLFWNGRLITNEQFGKFLMESHQLSPEPDLILEVEMGSFCHTLESVRDQMEKSLDCKSGYGRCVEAPSQIPEP